ncbi:MAG TPA: beta-ketoacyl synthase N-terminal-like domain-containing protein, partial [Candidatus Limnocylindria bacterium]|nr:beta-ketoacyl synthase N-terminal-like domain-containing protein [Candidatus Limnocylindria bacterium]
MVITGAGIVTALGFGWKTNAEGFRAGRTAFRPVTLFDVSQQRAKMAAEISLNDDLPRTKLSPRQITRLDRASKLLLHAAHEAWTQSGWEPTEYLPIALGTTSGGMSLGEAYFRQATQMPGRNRQQPARVSHYQAQRQALDLADAFEFQGPITIVSNACASGANAVGHAWHLVRTGQAERVFTGGYDAISH